MLIYVSRKISENKAVLEQAKAILYELQNYDLENAYICPAIAFSYMPYTKLNTDEGLELFIDLLSVCDKMIVASEITETVKREIEYAELFGLEVEYLNE